ncbi:MAG: cytochrome c oxidase assembly protein [Proteobacteria bacterium]|nr:MAG: cytochrome c oxidase assembly protein [Pseudomonadota bacterium]
MSTHKAANRSLTLRLCLFSAGFFGFGFALVPLYNVLCDVTGYGDRSKLRTAAEVVEAPVSDRLITVEMVSSVPAVGDWEFRPLDPTVEVRPGKLHEARFVAKNLRSQPTVAQAIPSIAPQQATRYFQKTECFCFTPQPFEAHESREFVVRFIVDPRLPYNMDRLTLAYTMYEAPDKVALAQ